MEPHLRRRVALCAASGCWWTRVVLRFSAGDYQRAAFFVWSGGWIAIAAGESSIGANVYKKDIGVAITSSNINWRGTANHPQWLAVNSEWTVRLYDERTAAILMNGTEVYRFNLPQGAIITEYGFGVLLQVLPSTRVSRGGRKDGLPRSAVKTRPPLQSSGIANRHRSTASGWMRSVRRLTLPTASGASTSPTTRSPEPIAFPYCRGCRRLGSVSRTTSSFIAV